MIKTLSFILSVWMFSAGTQADTAAHQYMLRSIANYSNAHSECEAQKIKTPAIPDATLQALADYPARDVEIYLMTRSHKVMDECAQPQLGELAIALETLEDVELQNDTREAMSAIRGLVFGNVRWELEKHYLQLPQKMRDRLNSYPEFQQPFESLPIRERLEQTQNPAP